MRKAELNLDLRKSEKNQCFWNAIFQKPKCLFGINMTSIVLYMSFSFFIIGCSTEDNMSYSEDAKIDSWVKSNKSKFDDINLKDISGYIGEEQRAIFRFIDEDNRKSIWIEKFELLKINNPNQKDIFEKVFNHISKMKFDKSLSNDDFIFFNNIIEEGRQRFNWSDEFIGITFCSFEFYNSDSEYNIHSTARDVLTHNHDDGSNGGGGLPVCNCKWGGMFACGPNTCSKGNCRDDNQKGCGFLLLEDCTGKCR
ncbi:bacteriocin fulvocin C-related protein [Flavobacterium azooxidireducens]|uniref:Bacteriocin fulvocin C-related protein n=1 Tax=Flavobacterium azooxidireducens TaxID=1871076 RepID=A0ABY4KGN8_9FLAO|nr:bacteriocin fulvocin C-related protein [Flavobacterium azooxidireducens]UPQ79968.1 bacteriocin fulvocin C-related protein [Flavobacterium azooxidireducens]